MKSWLLGLGVAAFLIVPIMVALNRSDNVKYVQTAPVASHDIVPTINAGGSISFKRQINVAPEVIGRVTAVLVKAGDNVVVGQPLVTLDAGSSDASVGQANAAFEQARVTVIAKQRTLELAEANVITFSGLAREGFIGKRNLDQYLHDRDLAKIDVILAQEGVALATATLRAAQTTNSKNIIRSPVSGLVLNTPTKVGEVAVPSSINLPGSVLAAVADVSKAYADVDVDESSITRVKHGAKAAVYIVGTSTDSLNGIVVETALSPRDGSGTQAYRVRIELDGNPPLLTGLSCRAEIVASVTHSAVAVPQEAVLVEKRIQGVRDVSQRYVFVTHLGQAARRDVQTGSSDDFFVEVRNGLKPGESVVVGPPKVLAWLRDGEQVREVVEGKIRD